MAEKQIVTGVAGFIGSSIAQSLLERGDAVIGVDCVTDYYAPKIKRANLEALAAYDGFTFVEKHIMEVDWPPVLDGASTVFHEAAQAGVRASWGKHFSDYTELNVLSTQVLLEAMKGSMKGSGARMVYASSSSIYGDTDELPMKEDHLPRPHSPYGVTKLAAEHLCGLYWRNFQIPCVSLRYFTVYGPRQRPDMAFHRFIKAALLGQKLTLYGDGDQTRDFTFIADAVQANLLAASRGEPGRVYNIGGGTRISINGALEIIGKATNKPLDIERQATQTGDVRHTYADTSRAREGLGFQPRVSLADGLIEQARSIEASLDLFG